MSYASSFSMIQLFCLLIHLQYFENSIKYQIKFSINYEVHINYKCLHCSAFKIVLALLFQYLHEGVKMISS